MLKKILHTYITHIYTFTLSPKTQKSKSLNSHRTRIIFVKKKCFFSLLRVTVLHWVYDSLGILLVKKLQRVIVILDGKKSQRVTELLVCVLLVGKRPTKVSLFRFLYEYYLIILASFILIRLFY